MSSAPACERTGGSECLRNHVLGKRGGVVRADQAELVRGREGEIDERLVELALAQLVRVAVVPRSARRCHACLHRCRRGRQRSGSTPDDARRLRPTTSISARCTLSARVPSASRSSSSFREPTLDEDRLVALKPLLHERARTLDEFVVARVEDGLMMKSRRGDHRGAHATVIPG